MPNFATLSDREFTPFCKYDARAGRWSSKREDGELFDVPQLTAIFDLAQLRTGWLQFNEGSAPDYVFDGPNSTIPPRPEGKYKRGFVVNLFSPQVLGGLRELASNSGVVSQGMQELYQAYEAAPEHNQGLVPVVKFDGSTPVKSGKSTNYQPHFSILKWVPRPQAMPLGVAKAANGNGATPAPSTFTAAPTAVADAGQQVPPPVTQAGPAAQAAGGDHDEF